MALDRQSIEKKDFPIARRGYEPEAVDAHLARLAAEIEALQRQAVAQPRQSAASSGTSATASLALAASEQVRTIVEAAETSAAEIERSAQADASDIRSEARSDAESTRSDAVAKSQEHVGAVSEATTLMLQRVTAMEAELGALTESLRTGANRLNADLSLLQGNMGELYGAAGGVEEEPVAPPPPPPVAPPPVEPVAEVAPPPPPPPAAVPEPTEEELLALAAGGTIEEVEIVEVEIEAPATAADSDVEGARLIALNMALNGQSRDETERYLADNFDLPDRAGLLDEVYASVDG